ncbi:unnamed protein product, partial [Mesorhabditis belari]|uniref:Uncharacterized protein n=1 Tax=Mesorhabditis belari TaxID=2138241 RepID=A0AAF3F2T9_9BILA
MAKQIFFLLVSVVCVAISQFQIPLPFGSLNFGKREDGKVEVGVNQEANFFGYGSKGNLKLVSGNGTLETESGHAAIVNNTDYGAGGKIAFDKQKGVDLGSKATVGDKKIEASATRPDDFFSQLFGAIKGKRDGA